MKNSRKNNGFEDPGFFAVAQGSSWVALGASWGGLGPLLKALRVVLGDLGSFLRDLEAVLGRSWGLLVRSWGLLARSWAVLDGQGGQKGSEPGSLTDQEREVLPPPPSDSPVSTPPLAYLLNFQGQGKEERGTIEFKNRRMQGREGRKKCMVEIFEEKRGMMVKEKGCSARREAQGAGGFFVFPNFSPLAEGVQYVLYQIRNLREIPSLEPPPKVWKPKSRSKTLGVDV